MKKSDKNRAIIAEAITRSWRENEFRKQFKNDPKKVLSAAGADIGPDINVVVLENSSSIYYGVLPAIAEQEQYKDRLAKVVSRLESLPENLELRIVRDSAHITHIVIPAAPTSAGALSDEVLEQIAGGDCEAVSTNTTEAVEAESTEVTVTQTTELQDAETTTTVAAEAELVIVAI